MTKPHRNCMKQEPALRAVVALSGIHALASHQVGTMQQRLPYSYR
jgi:hypothetical protein